MFHSRHKEKRINRTHERVLRLVHDNLQDFSFSDLFLKDNSVTILQKKISKPTVLKQKVKQEITPEITSNLFLFTKKLHNLRNSTGQ